MMFLLCKKVLFSYFYDQIYLKITYLDDCLIMGINLYYVNGKRREPPTPSPLRRSVSWLPLAEVNADSALFFVHTI